jgi:two-component system, NarL family, nitrate/nitrite response regulator NarL
MTLLLGCADPTLSERWQKFLCNDYQLRLAASTVAMSALIDPGSVKLLLIHRAIADLDSIREFSRFPLIVLTDVPEDLEGIAIYRAGALGYVNSYSTEERLKEVVRVALAGQIWIGQNLMSKIIRGTTAKISSSVHFDEGNLARITGREWEVALLVSKGLTNQQIAQELDIVERTVKAHLGSLFSKTGVGSRLQLALWVKKQFGG